MNKIARLTNIAALSAIFMVSVQAQSPEDRLRQYKAFISGKTYAITEPVGCVAPAEIEHYPGNVETKLVNKCGFPANVVACDPYATTVGGSYIGGIANCAESIANIIYLSHSQLDPHPPKPGGYSTATGSWGEVNPFRSVNVVACPALVGEREAQIGLGNPVSFWMIQKTQGGTLTAKCLTEVRSNSHGGMQEWPFYRDIFSQVVPIRIDGPRSTGSNIESSKKSAGDASVLPATTGKTERLIADKLQQTLGLQATNIFPSLLGLWEVTTGDQTLYVDSDAAYAFDGRLISADTRDELTKEKRDSLRKFNHGMKSATPERAPRTSPTNSATVSALFEKSFGRKPDGVAKAPLGLWEIVLGTSVLYVDSPVATVFDGKIIKTSTKQDISEVTKDRLLRIKFDQLPLNMSIKNVVGNGKKTLAVFADPNCQHCKKLEESISEIDDVTIYTFLYPILGSNSVSKSQSIWCATDQVAAWKGAVLNSRVPNNKNESCEAPVGELLALGQKLNISGTPTIFLKDGRRISGSVSADQLHEHLLSVEKKR